MNTPVVDFIDLQLSSYEGGRRVRKLPMTGRFLRCISATDDFFISFDGGPKIPFGAGRSYQGLNFSSVEFSQTTFVRPNDISVVYGDIEYTDNRVSFLTTPTVKIAEPTNFIAKTTVLMAPTGNPNQLIDELTPGQNMPADAIVTLSEVRNLSANDIYISSSNGPISAPPLGYVLMKPNESRTFPGRHRIYAKGAGGESVEMIQYFYT